ncbi:MAG: hypothetical protein QW491_14645 [Thermoproteota archaeon]
MIASMRYCGGDGHAIEEADRIGEEAGERAGRETGCSIVMIHVDPA